MTGPETCWDLIRDARERSALAARQQFCVRYEPVLRAYLRARWTGTPYAMEIDDTLQEIFVDCFRDGGALERTEERAGGFRAFLFGIARTAALRVEQRRARSREQGLSSTIGGTLRSDDTSPSSAFDRAWALALVRRAIERHARAAVGDAGRRRVEILRNRFGEGLPVRAIAARLRLPDTFVHKEYARARRDFRQHLLDVVGEHHPGDPGAVERTAISLLTILRENREAKPGVGVDS